MKIGSYLSVALAGSGTSRKMAGGDDVDLKGIGETFVDTFQVMIDRTRAFTAKHGADAIMHVQYSTLMSDPVGTVRSIYERFDEDYTAEAQAATTAYLAQNQKGKHGKHTYDLGEFGLSKDAVRERFANYIEDFAIPIKG